MSEQTQESEAPVLKNIFAIRLELPGVRACGPYKAGNIYKIGEDGLDKEEANRLVDVKGFAALTSAKVTAAEKNTKKEGG